jgi:hypothetical protein
MPNRRAIGNSLSDIGNLLMQFSMRTKLAQDDDQRQLERQRELARTADQARIAAREDAQRQQVLTSILGDPTGQKAQMMVDAGQSEWAPYVPSGDVATTRVADTFNTAKSRTELPTDVGLETRLAASPGGRGAAKDPTAIERLIAERNARKASFDTEDTTQTTLQGERAFAEGEGRGRGINAATEAFAPTARRIEVDKEKALTPVLVSRAGQTATAQQSAETKGAADRQRQAWELAAQDPANAAAAEQVLANPELLAKIDARSRKYVLQAMQAEKFRPATMRKTQEILDVAWNSLQELKTAPGMAGAVGAKGPTSLFGILSRPAAGSSAGDYRSIIDRFQSAVTLSNLDLLRGLGHMSDMEFGTVAKASTSWRDNVSEARFVQQLPVTEQALRATYARAGLTPPGGGSTVSAAQEKLNQLRATRPR